MEPDNQNPDQAPDQSSEDALKDLTAELENFTADDQSMAEPSAPEAPAEPAASEAPAEPTEPALDTPSEPSAPTAAPAATLDDSDADAPYAPDPIDNPTPASSLTDFTKVPVADDKEDDKESEEKKDMTPLKPAAPVPGSIGSAKSYDPNEAAKPPKKKLGTTTILAIVLIAILVVAVIVVVLLLVLQPGSNSNNNNSDANTGHTVQQATPVEYTTLTCTQEILAEQIEPQIAGLLTISDRIIGNYEDGVLADLSDTMTLKFDSTDNAVLGYTTVQELYIAQLEELGIDDGDPFSSSYDRSRDSVTVTRMAKSNELTTTNAALFGITAEDGEQLDTSASALATLYAGAGWSCQQE